MRFLALDVETANPDYSSICQIGIATFEDDKLIDTWSTLVNPEDYFDCINVSIHGIAEADVKKSPTMLQLYEKIKQLTEGNIVIHHMPFDKVALNRAFTKYELEQFQINWLDSAKVARRTWDEFAYSGYGLKNVSDKLNIKFEHHDALEDAIAAGKIVLKAIEESKFTIEDIIRRSNQPINLSSCNKIHLEGNPEGILFGETIVFTGTLSIERKEAVELAAKAGCIVIDGVNKNITILVVGIQDLKKLNGKQKSSKQIKAEQLISKGLDIKIITEEDFKAMVG